MNLMNAFAASRYKYLFVFASFYFAIIQLPLFAQPAPPEAKHPKLVIGIVVDQMRWDFLYRYR